MAVPIRLLTTAIFLLLQIVMSLSSTPPLNSTQTPLCRPSQSFAFLQFKNHFVISCFNQSAPRICFPQAPKTETWREGTNCCLWEGVECHHSTANVITLNLSCSGLYGQIPTNSSLFQLSHLQTLYLSFNDFNGSPLSSELGRLVNLKHLHISDSNFSGMIPSQISHLSNLISLDIEDNLIFDSLTFEMLSKNLTRLKHLSLSQVNMSSVNLKSFLNLSASLEGLYLLDCLLHGKFPVNVFRFLSLKSFWMWDSPKLTITLPKSNWSGPLESLFLYNTSFSTEQFYSLENLKSLNFLAIEDCGLRGPIPRFISNLTQINDLSLSNNNITGEIPTFLSNLKQLTFLSLSGNNLKGQVPDLFGNLTMLTYLYLDSNNLEGHLPSSIFRLPQLSRLDLSNNELVSLSSNVTSFSQPTALNYLNLSYNHSSGTLQLPWQNLHLLDLRSNMFQGLLPIPPPNIKYFFISENNFSGKVSSLYCNMSSLEILDLSHNNLSGTIPSCLGNLTTNLLVLNLQRNSFHGMIPTTYAEECKLRNLNMQGNRLEGKIPSSLVNCKYLEALDLGHNMFNEEFPEWLKTLPMLRVLVLRSNKLHGPLPNFANDSFSKIQVLDLSDNSLVGHLPNIENLQAVANVDESEGPPRYLGIHENNSGLMSYDYSIALSIKGNMIEMQKVFHVFTSIDLSNNKFEGEIPFDIGKLLSLKGLNLSHNVLKGRIPPSIGNLKSLEWLDLSSNKLIGDIPEQLIDVTSLEILNLSDNQLVGHIPEGKQFNTFTSESYKGNLGLCGYPLLRKCKYEESEQPVALIDDEKTCFFDRGIGWQSVGIGYGCGMVFGVGMGYVMFRYQRPQWLLFIIEKKLRLRPQRRRNSQRRMTRRNYKF